MGLPFKIKKALFPRTRVINRTITQTSESSGLELGETDATAYRGDRGKTAYDYSQVGHIPSSYLDTDATMAANSDSKVATQKSGKAYSDAKVADAINNGTTTVAPSQNAVYDALALKANLASPSFTGTVTSAGLIDLSGAGAGQIKFPATQNASADANTLDDYEEGDWTPNINFEGGITGMTHSSQVGSYTKIGRQMSINGSDVLTAKGSSTGTLKMKNLPVVSRNVTGSTYPCAVKTYSFNAVGMIQAYVANNDTNIVFSQMSTAGAVTFLNETHVKDDSIIQIFATYFT